MPNDNNKELTKELIDGAVEEAFSVALWIDNVLVPWASNENSKIAAISKNLNTKLTINEDSENIAATIGLFCKLSARISGTDLDCRCCPLSLSGSMANKATKAALETPIIREFIVSTLRSSFNGRPHSLSVNTTYCLGVLISAVARSKSEELRAGLTNLVGILNPFHLAFYYSIKSYFGIFVRKDSERLTSNAFGPPDEGDEEYPLIGLDQLFSPNKEE